MSLTACHASASAVHGPGPGARRPGVRGMVLGQGGRYLAWPVSALASSPPGLWSVRSLSRPGS